MQRHRQPKKSFKMDEEKLVESVREYPCLWQVSSMKYKDEVQRSRAKENAWKEVAIRV